MIVVVNTSPLLLLGKIGQLNLLPHLYSQIVVPESVWQELHTKPGNEVQQIQALIETGVFSKRQATPHYLNQASFNLGPGEEEAIALAMELQAGLVILDDLEGRQIARQKSLPVTGTIGVLIEARERGLLISIRRELDRLIEAGIVAG